MISSTARQLIGATVLIGTVIALTGRALVAPERLNYYHLVLLSVAVFFGIGTWSAYLYGNYSLPAYRHGAIIDTYIVLFLYVFGVKLIEGLAVSRAGRRQSQARISIARGQAPGRCRPG